MEVAKVIWEDAQFWENWVGVYEAVEAKPYLITTYGIVLQDDEHHLTVAGEEKDGRCRYVTKVPKENVREIKYLSEKRVKTKE